MDGKVVLSSLIGLHRRYSLVHQKLATRPQRGHTAARLRLERVLEALEQSIVEVEVTSAAEFREKFEYLDLLTCRDGLIPDLISNAMVTLSAGPQGGEAKQ